MSSRKDYWKVLGLEPGASSDKVKAAQRRLAQELHPDRLPAGATPEQRKVINDKMAEINEAAEALLRGEYPAPDSEDAWRGEYQRPPPARNQGPRAWEYREEEWAIKKRSRRERNLVVAAVAVTALVAASIAIPSLIQEYSGPTPLWHPFSGVFDSSGQLATEGCSLQNLQPGPFGVGYVKTPATYVSCSYHGASYDGYYQTDCNLTPSGPIPRVNGTLVPYDGCVLSTAPLTRIFTNLFTLSAKKTNDTIQVYSNRRVVANMTPTATWKAFRCSLVAFNATQSNGPLTCAYLGIPYVATDVLQGCNLGTPIQLNGVPIPQDSCQLTRNDPLTT